MIMQRFFATLLCNVRISGIKKTDDAYIITYSHEGDSCEALTGFLVNATYASANQILKMAGADSFGIKYELCEIILCKSSDALRDIGFTVMDGPFFSIMPFGLTGLHSLTSVAFTPHVISYDTLPKFTCQNGSDCSPEQLGNCNLCPNRPESAWPYMH